MVEKSIGTRPFAAAAGLLLAAACTNGGASAQETNNGAGPSANVAGASVNVANATQVIAIQPAVPAGDCRATLTGVWTWNGVNRTLVNHGMPAMEMEARMELAADGRFTQRQRSRADGEAWAEGESSGSWSATRTNGSSDPRHCTLTMEGNTMDVMLTDGDSLTLPGLGVTYRREER